MLSARGDARRRSRLTTVAVAVALAASACSSDPADPTSSPEASKAERSEFTQTELACVTGGYACSWSDAEPGAAERSEQILTIAAALAESGESAEQIAGAIEAAPDVASVSFDALGVMFRVEGGVPVFVDVDPTTSGNLLSSGAPRPADAVLPSLAQGGVFTGCAAADPDTDGEVGVTRTAGEPKHALLLSPWQFGLPWDVATLRSNLLLSTSRYNSEYGGSVTVKQTPADGQSVTFPNASNVVPSDFCGWEQYDTIVLMTHGRALCERYDDAGDPAGCLTSFSVGQYSESAEETRRLVGQATGVTVGVGRYGDLRSTLTREEKDACIAELEGVVLEEGDGDGCFELLPTPQVSVKVTTDFFRANYPNGLPDRLIFVAACQGMKFGDLGTALGSSQGNGQLLGFSQIAVLDDAQRLLNEFTERLGLKDRIGQDFKDWANGVLDDRGAETDLYDYPLSDLPGGELGDFDTAGRPTWGSDVVSIASAGEELVDGAEVALAPSSDDRLLVTLLLSDVVDGETPEEYQVELLWNDQPVDIGTPSWGRSGEKDMEAEVEVQLPRALEPEETFDLEIRGVLPGADGAPTRWKFTDLTAKVGTVCDLLDDGDVSGALGVAMTRDPDGNYGEGFFGDFCSWLDGGGTSQMTVLVVEGAADGFRAEWADSEMEVDGFGDVAVYDMATGNAEDCPKSTDPQTGQVQWVCFVNLNVAFGDDVLYFTLSGNIVGEDGTENALSLLRDLVRTARNAAGLDR